MADNTRAASTQPHPEVQAEDMDSPDEISPTVLESHSPSDAAHARPADGVLTSVPPGTPRPRPRGSHSTSSVRAPQVPKNAGPETLEQATEIIEALRRDVGDRSGVFRELQVKVEEYRRIADALEVTLHELRRENESLTDEIQVAENRRGDAERDRDKLIGKLRHEKELHKQTVKRLELAKDENQRSHASKTSEIATLKEGTEKRDEKISTLEHHLQEMFLINEQHTGNIHELTDKLAKVESSCAEAQLQIDVRDERIGAVECDLENLVGLQAYVSDLQTRLAGFLGCSQETVSAISPQQIVYRIHEVCTIDTDRSTIHRAASDRADSPTKHHSSRSSDDGSRPSDLEAMDILKSSVSVKFEPQIIDGDDNETINEIIALNEDVSNSDTIDERKPSGLSDENPSGDALEPRPPEREQVKELPPVLPTNTKESVVVIQKSRANHRARPFPWCLIGLCLLLVVNNLYYFSRFQCAQTALESWVNGNAVRPPGSAYRPGTFLVRVPVLAELLALLDMSTRDVVYKPGVMKG